MNNYLKLILGTVVLLQLTSCSGDAVDNEELKTAYENGEFSKVVEIARNIGTLENPRALHSLGRVYETGEGVTQDYAKAIDYYEQASVKGNSNAENNLGLLYIEGKGVERDPIKACEWFASSSEANNAAAQDNFGLCHLYGDGGVTQDFTKAGELFKASAYQGYLAGQYNYATHLFNTESQSKGYFWYRLVHERGDKRAGEIIEQVEKQLTAVELEAVKTAVKLCIQSIYKSCDDEVLLEK